MAQTEPVAFPRLTDAELALVKPLATPCDYADGATVFRAGQADIDLYIVESGHIEIRTPTDGDRLVVTHEPGQFSGDIDVLTGRPVIVTAVARGAVRSGSWPRSDRDPCPLETTAPGILAAGDIRSGSTKRVAFAVGDGALAGTCPHRLPSITR